MVLIAEGFSATRIVGLTAYAAALAACVAQWLRDRRGLGLRRIYAALALTQLVLLLDIVFDWRWKLHDLFMRAAIAENIYGERRQPQRIALTLVALLTVSFAGWLLWKLRRSPGAAIACVATVFSLALHGVETISYHNVDAVLYRMVGSVMAVSLLWAAFAGFTCLGVWMDWRREA